MDDKTCRFEILRRLKEAYDKDGFGLLGKFNLQDSLAVEENVVDRNMRYLEQKGLVNVSWTLGGGFRGRITAEGIDFLETGEPSGLAILSPLTVHQEFHGPVGAVAGRDINVQISFNEVLNKLADAVDANPKIPKEEQRSLTDRLKSLAENEWVRSIGTDVLASLIKNRVVL